MSAARIDKDITSKAMGEPHESMAPLGDSYRALLRLPATLRVESRTAGNRRAATPELVRLREEWAHAMNPPMLRYQDRPADDLRHAGSGIERCAPSSTASPRAAPARTRGKMQAVVSMAAYLPRAYPPANRGRRNARRASRNARAPGGIGSPPRLPIPIPKSAATSPEQREGGHARLSWLPTATPARRAFGMPARRLRLPRAYLRAPPHRFLYSPGPQLHAGRLHGGGL